MKEIAPSPHKDSPESSSLCWGKQRQSDQDRGKGSLGPFESSKEAPDPAWRAYWRGVRGDPKLTVSLPANIRKGDSEGSALGDKSSVELVPLFIPRHRLLQWGPVEGPEEILHPDSTELRNGEEEH